ncbi:MAG TPA: MMPL family transporter [Blastocatellia bacterium]|nr:MMPL family transporter [Blastocatellia bacterium]
MISRIVISRPKTIIATILALTIGFIAAIAARGIYFDGSPETLARNDAALRFFNETRKTFGDDRVIIVALTTTDVFTPQFIEKLERLTNVLAALDGVEQAQSLTNLKAIRRNANGISVEKLIAHRRVYDANELSQLKEQVTRDPLYARNFVSTDGRTAAINVFLKPANEAQARAVAEEVERVAKAEAGADEVLLAGVPIIDARGIRSMARDLAVLTPIAALLCVAVFFIAFGSFWGAALPVAALVIGLVWTIGLMSLSNRPFTIATMPLPTVLMAVGGSYMFHVLNQYRLSMSQLDDSSDKRAAWLDGMIFIIPAVTVSGLTTMAGFGALASSSVPTVRDMGIFEAAGVLAMLVLTLTFVPAALTLLPRSALGDQPSRQKDYARWLNPLLKNITALILHRRRAVLIACIAATIVTGAGAAWLRINTDYLNIFPRASETVQAAEKLHERLAGAATVAVVVSGNRGAVADPQFLNGMDALERFALEQPGVDAAISVADLVKRLEGVMNPSAGESVPKDHARLDAMLNDYLSSDETLVRLVSADRSSAVIVLRTNLFGSNELRALTEKIEARARDILPAGATAQATGSAVLLNGASDAIAASQTSSLAIAIVTIYLMMVALFRSLATALLALIPNLVPIIGYFGFLGWSGVTLDITTSLIASAALGLAVDNAVHMIRRYRQSVADREQSLRADMREAEGWAMWLTMMRSGKPMVLANLMLIAAFLIFMLSSFVPVRLAGMLWAVAIFICLVANLVLLPALMKSKPFARAALGDAARLPEKSSSLKRL